MFIEPESRDTYKLQAVRKILNDVIQNVTACRPVQYHSEPALLHTSQNADESQDVWMGQ